MLQATAAALLTNKKRAGSRQYSILHPEQNTQVDVPYQFKPVDQTFILGPISTKKGGVNSPEAVKRRREQMDRDDKAAAKLMSSTQVAEESRTS